MGWGKSPACCLLQTERIIDPPVVETVARSEMVEGLFKMIYVWHLDKPSPGDYFKYLLRWTKEGMCAGYAYMERAHMYIGAKCFLQARADAQAAVDFWEALRQKGDRELVGYRLTRCLMDQVRARPFRLGQG